MRRPMRFGSQDSLRASTADEVAAEQRDKARRAVASGVSRTGGTLDDLGDALAMLDLVDEDGRPT